MTKARLYAALLRDVHTLAGPHRPIFYTAVACAFVLSLVDGLFMIVAVDFVMVAMGGQSDFSGLLKALFAVLGFDARGSVELLGLFVLVGAGFLRAVVSGVANTFNIIAATRTVNYARRAILASVLQANFAYIDHLKSGHVREVLSTSVGGLIRIVQNLMQFLASAVTTCILMGVLCDISWRYTVLVACAGLASIPLKLISVRYVHRFAKESALGRLNLMERINETLLGVRQVKLQNRESQFLGLVEEDSRIAEVSEQKAKLMASWESPAAQIVMLILIALFAVAARGHSSLADLVAYLLVLYRTITPALQASQLFTALVKKLPEVRYAIAFYKLDAREREAQPDSTMAGPKLTGASLRFAGVSFGYKQDKPILHDVEFSAKRGEIVAIVGASGAGKSSILHLMLRMYDPTQGSVIIDDHDLRTVPPRQVRDTVGLVSQDVHLFNLSVADIIRGPRRDLSDIQVADIARLADAHTFISNLPAGYQTVVGERGLALSGGQRQRLFIAQILARQTPILLLDEATSALDVHSEARIFDQLKPLQSEKILIVITHRVELVRDADRIIVLDEGRIVETGSWARLTEKRGTFWALLQRRATESDRRETEAMPLSA